jgi:hypothetical protein
MPTVLKSGYAIVEVDGGEWRRQYLVLTPNALFTFGSSAETSTPLRCVVIVRGSHVAPEPKAGSSNCSKLSNHWGKYVVFMVDTAVEQDTWLRAIQSAILDGNSILRTYITKNGLLNINRRFFILDGDVITSHKEYDQSWAFIDKFVITPDTIINCEDNKGEIKLKNSVDRYCCKL